MVVLVASVSSEERWPEKRERRGEEVDVRVELVAGGGGEVVEEDLKRGIVAGRSLGLFVAR